MPIKAGGIDLVDGIVNALFKVAVLEQVVAHLAGKLGPGAITDADMTRFRKKALEDLQQQYPEAGLKPKP